MENLFSTINLILTIATIIGGIIVYRSSLARTANEVQERVIHALESELTSMRGKLDAMKAENTRLSLVIDIICAALRNRGIAVSIDGDMVSIKDGNGNDTMARIREELKS